MRSAQAAAPPPRLLALFLRFLRIGALAWGGPVAQIGTLHRELVEQERWVDAARFRRALAVYQLLPGPEATEMCIWFGTIARGRLGGLLAGLGFVLPGITLMLLASWWLLELPSLPPRANAAFAGMQCAVTALVALAAVRLGKSTLHAHRWLAVVVLMAACMSWLGLPFAWTLLCGGAFALLPNPRAKLLGTLLWGAALLAWCYANPSEPNATLGATSDALLPPTMSALGTSGLRAGLLTFGGAYTAIPFLQADAVGPQGWMTLQRFQDGLAVGGVVPSPLITFSAWVGWAGGGLVGALLVVAAIFLPAFLFPLLLHHHLETVANMPRLHRMLDGVAAAVVGLIAVTALHWVQLLDAPWRVALAVATMLALLALRSRATVLLAVVGSGLFGMLLGG